MNPPSHDEEIEAYQDGLVIEDANLDDECKQHARTHSEIALAAARATSRAAGLKLDLKESRGEWETEIRDRLNDEGRGDGPKGRVTDKQVEAELSSHPKLNARNRQIVEVESEARDWEALRESSNGRGYQIRNIVDLSIAGLLTPRTAKASRRTAKQLEQNETGRARF